MSGTWKQGRLHGKAKLQRKNGMTMEVGYLLLLDFLNFGCDYALHFFSHLVLSILSFFLLFLSALFPLPLGPMGKRRHGRRQVEADAVSLCDVHRGMVLVLIYDGVFLFIFNYYYYFIFFVIFSFHFLSF